MQLDNLDQQALWLTLELALFTTAILLMIGTPLAWMLSRGKSRWWAFADALVSLPLVLPPTVLGFYLLVAFSPRNELGSWWQTLTGQSFAFSFTGILIASVLYSLPFVVQPLQSAFKQMGNHYIKAAACLGVSPWRALFNVVIPMNKRTLLMAASLGFAHTIGEFGVVLMVGGSIPGETRVMSIALFEHVEAGEMFQAHLLAAILLIFALILLVSINVFQRQHLPGEPHA